MPESVPLETIRNLFGMDLPETYKADFSIELPFTPHQMVAILLKGEDLEEMAAQLNEAAEDPVKSNYSVGCVNTPNGSCFAYARYKRDNGIYSMIFLSSTIEKKTDLKNQEFFSVDPHSFLIGVEDEDNGQRQFNIVGCSNLSIIDEEENTDLLSPTDAPEFYSSLCYMQQSLASCLCGEELDLYRNQCWLDPIVVKRAYAEFSNLVGATSVDDIKKTYNDRRNMLEELAAEYEDDEQDEVSPPQYPERKLLLN